MGAFCFKFSAAPSDETMHQMQDVLDVQEWYGPPLSPHHLVRLRFHTLLRRKNVICYSTDTAIINFMFSIIYIQLEQTRRWTLTPQHCCACLHHLRQPGGCLHHLNKKSNHVISKGASAYSLQLSSRLRKLFMRYCGTPIFPSCYWLRGTVVERRSSDGVLSLSCARPVADG